MYDFCVVGAGITGITAASVLARERRKKVILVEKRDHIGGNCYDCYDEHGILIHKYGPHIFHTKYKEVWDYLSQFTDWIPYVHKVLAFVDGKYIAFPVNLNTMEQLFNKPFTANSMKKWIETNRVPIENPRNAEEMVISRMGWYLYEKFFKNYTRKQWGIDARELAPEVTTRIPIRFNRDDRYFTDTYQGIPRDGYTKMFERMLRQKNIDVMLNTDYQKIVDYLTFNKMIFTGPIDYFFNYQFGHLPYRGIRFDFNTADRNLSQPAAVINYPNDFLYTRVTDFKHITGQKRPYTCRCYEYPDDCVAGNKDIVPSYPLPTKEAKKAYKKYKQQTGTINTVKFLGRLAEYQYYDMDLCVKIAMDTLRKN